MQKMLKSVSRKEIILIVVAALGYFVDIYDLILFSIVRKKSLMGIGVSEADCMVIGEQLISLQMLGMLVGGILWGVLGDKKGRLSVLFGSILMYSLANIANGFVENVWSYGVWRVIAGIGLAGELGAGITLVSETMSKEMRGYGTMIVTTFGVLGGVVGGFIAELFEWRTSYFVGGGMGLVLLALRIGVFESGMYEKAKLSNVARGSLKMIFTNKKRFLKYLKCILIGLPIWYFAGILITFSPEFSKALGISEVSAGTAVVLFYAGITLGDFSSGLISQLIKSRKKVVLFFLLLSIACMLLYLFSRNISKQLFYTYCFLTGFASGYWAIFVTIASEQFGTNLRSTVTTTTPNFVRGSLPLLIQGFNFFKYILPLLGLRFLKSNNEILIFSALIVGSITLVIALMSLKGLEETFGKDLNYLEE